MMAIREAVREVGVMTRLPGGRSVHESLEYGGESGQGLSRPGPPDPGSPGGHNSEQEEADASRSVS